MVYIVDTVQVDPKDADEYVRAVETMGVPVMTGAGARFVSCATTTADVGEPVSIQTTWAAKDHVEWNDIRKNMVLNPAWYEYAGKISGLWQGGCRRFFYPTAASPER
ncbi:MAG: hypothetical protein J2P57_08340 [Acidimicrobiaceae bacterium]|nr:hypothetical protein [Acidimicrobiaceae bacterium]